MPQYRIICYIDNGCAAEEKRSVIVDAKDPFEARCKAKEGMEQAGMDVKAVGPAVNNEFKGAPYWYDAANECVTVDVVFLFLLLKRLGLGLGQLRELCNERERVFLDLVVWDKGHKLHPLGVEDFKDENDS